MRRVISRVLVIAALVLFWPAISNGQSGSSALPPAVDSAARTGGQTGQEHGQAQLVPALTSAPRQDQVQPRDAAHAEQLAGIPPITDADRKAAFPDVTGHAVHDNAVNYFMLFDQLEWQTGDGRGGVSWDNKGWIGRDLDRFWFRTEGDGEAGRLGAAQAHLLYGRAIARWWDLVVGVRQDIRPGPARTWAAVGIQGLAPYWFEVEATAYIGASGRSHFRFETEYELLLTNRLILQPLVEVEIYGKSDPERGIGVGLSTADAGLRLRYELRRELAPYVGVTWNRKFFGTADFAKAAGEKSAGARLTVGLRFWL